MQPVLEDVVRVGALVAAHARVVLRSQSTRRQKQGCIVAEGGRRVQRRARLRITISCTRGASKMTDHYLFHVRARYAGVVEEARIPTAGLLACTADLA